MFDWCLNCMLLFKLRGFLLGDYMKKLMILSLFLIVSCAHGENTTSQTSQSNRSDSNWMNLSASERKQMSEIHQKMADCLSSNKSISECRDSMRSQYPMMKDGNWGMMGHGHMMGDDGHHGCMDSWW